MIAAFITNKKIPKVKMVIGIVSMVSMGFTMAFINASTIATSKEVIKLSTFTPGKRLEAIRTATAVTRIFIKKFN